MANVYMMAITAMEWSADFRGDTPTKFCTDEVVKAAARNWKSGKEVIMVLLQQREAEVVITEEVGKSAATGGQEGVLKTIEEHFKISLSKEELSIA
jgi:hypothetical protein